MRRLGTLIVTMALAIVAIVPMADAGPPDRVELMKSFKNGVRTGDTRPAGRILPWEGLPPQTFCDDQTLGLWIFWAGPDRSDLLATTNSFVLDGTTLVTERTKLKKYTTPTGDKWWFFAEGVPVLGTLGLGTHTSEWTHSEPVFPIPTTDTVVFEVKSCP